MQKIANKKLFITIVLGAVFTLIMIVQFVVLGVLNSKTNTANSNLAVATEQNKQLSSDINYLNSVEAKKEYARQQLGYKEVDEEIFIGQ